jgi:hypothetical protein
MLDTNIFNHLLDGKISSAALAGRHLLVIGVQRDELGKTRDPERRAALIAKFEAINPTVILASSFALDIEGAGFGQAYWNDGSGNFEKMRSRLRELDFQQKKKPVPLDQAGNIMIDLNQERDILIAETAIKNRAILVTGDRNLRQVVSEFGGFAIDSEEFESRRLALQLHILATSESMDHHDSEIMDDGRIDRGDA